MRRRHDSGAHFSGVCLLGVKYGEYIIGVQRSVNFIARLIGADGLIKTS